MTVYVDYITGHDLTESRLWADTTTELDRFTSRLGLPARPGRRVRVIGEALWRRAILMGAIPAHPTTVRPDQYSGVAA